MEQDGKYEDFLGRITYNYGDLNEQLSAPVNMYNGRRPFFVEVLHVILKQSWNVYKFVVEWIMNFSSGLQQIPIIKEG